MDHHQQLALDGSSPPESAGKLMVVRMSGPPTPFNANDAIAIVVDLIDAPIATSIRARLGRSAKQLLEDGFEPKIVIAAMVAAVRMGRPGLMDSFAQEYQVASRGMRMTFRELNDQLDNINAEQNPAKKEILDALRRRRQK